MARIHVDRNIPMNEAYGMSEEQIYNMGLDAEGMSKIMERAWTDQVRGQPPYSGGLNQSYNEPGYQIQSSNQGLLDAIDLAVSRGDIQIDRIDPGQRIWSGGVRRRKDKRANQLAKSRRRKAQGKPSYRKRQASARASQAKKKGAWESFREQKAIEKRAAYEVRSGGLQCLR